ncbi:MAG: hypothetical protein KGL74_02395, partial [Elusimicrobia bacterium]|nr:hypothetical protein [Elusimicrobiota bacterium]
MTTGTGDLMALSGERREGPRSKRLLPVLLSAAIILPNNPFVASAAAQVIGAELGAARPGANAGASVVAGGTALAPPAPLSLTTLPVGAPSATLTPAPA